MRPTEIRGQPSAAAPRAGAARTAPPRRRRGGPWAAGGTIRHQQSAIRNSSSGQAMVELTVALIVIVVLLAGLIQIGQLTAAHTRTMITARSMAAETAMGDDYAQPEGANYIQTWSQGFDEKHYTRDDTPLIVTNPAADTQEIVAMAHPEELAAWTPTNALSIRGLSPDTLDEFFLVWGYDSESCPILTAIRKLAYDQDSVSVRSDVWMVWMKGIY